MTSCAGGHCLPWMWTDGGDPNLESGTINEGRSKMPKDNAMNERFNENLERRVRTAR